MTLILLAKSSVQTTEIIFYLSMAASILILLLMLFHVAFGDESKKGKSTQKNNKKEPKTIKQDKDVIEIFDYLGTKIIHENGVYTVNDKGALAIYNSWEELPLKYQKMVKELDNRSLQKNADSYFLESINGIYYLTFPDGKQKKYKNLNDIPAHIRKTIGR